MGLVKLINSVKRLSVCAAFVSILRQRLNCRLNGLVNRFSKVDVLVGWRRQKVFSQIFMRGAGGDDGGKDVHYFWFDLVNSGHMYRM